MGISAETLNELIERELAAVSDKRVHDHIRIYSVSPKVIMRDWDYGESGQQYQCWTVLEHPPTNTGIAYCEEGFGPTHPWGLVSLEGRYMSMGMDAGWFGTFLQAYFDSMPVTELPIWRVFRIGDSGIRQPISNERGWEQTWEEIMALRKADPSVRYDCGTSVI